MWQTCGRRRSSRTDPLWFYCRRVGLNLGSIERMIAGCTHVMRRFMSIQVAPHRNRIRFMTAESDRYTDWFNHLVAQICYSDYVNPKAFGSGQFSSSWIFNIDFVLFNCFSFVVTIILQYNFLWGNQVSALQMEAIFWTIVFSMFV